MTRRSARLDTSSSTKTSVVDINRESPNTTENLDNDEDLPEVDAGGSDDEDVRPKKRRKSSKPKKMEPHPRLQFKNVRGRRGALKDIVEMPLDILHEIFMYLTSAEVLYLSQMCKALRHILMTKSAEHIWRQARLNLDGFPDCPDDLNEAQFANLIFGLCDYCNKTKARYFIWSYRRRCCRSCISRPRKNGLVRHDDLPKKMMDVREHLQLQSILPSINPYDKSENLDPKHSSLFCEASAIILCGEYCKLGRHAQQAWMVEWAFERKRRILHGRLCDEWLKKQDENRAAQLKNTRQRRYEAIKQRLTDLGWGKTFARIRGIEAWPSVNQPKDLTDRIWDNIKDELIAELAKRKACHAEEDYAAAKSVRANILITYLRDLKRKPLDKMICPDFFVLTSTEPVSALYRAPTEETVEISEDLVLETIQNWRQSSDTQLRNMVVAGSTSISKPSAVDPLSLATTFFRCWDRDCSEPTDVLQYPEILTHGCATLLNRTQMCLWNASGKRLFFADRTYTLARTILEASGLDPETTTREDVQWPECYFECHECPTAYPPGHRVLMAWHKALSHAIVHDGRDEHPRIARVTAFNDADLRHVQDCAINDIKSQRKNHFACARCKEPRVVDHWYAIEYHIEKKHQKDQGPEKPVYLTDYVIEPTPYGLPRQPNRLLMLPPA